jgi:hypothetical protein
MLLHPHTTLAASTWPFGRCKAVGVVLLPSWLSGAPCKAQAWRRSTLQRPFANLLRLLSTCMLLSCASIAVVSAASVVLSSRQLMSGSCPNASSLHQQA